MSLLYWWPFIKDGSNQGLRQTNNLSISLDNNGKIGKCAVLTSALNLGLTASNSDIDIYSQNNTELTYAFWLKIDKTWLNDYISTAAFSGDKDNINNCIIGFDKNTSSFGLGLYTFIKELTNASVLDEIPINIGFRHSAVNGTISLGNILLDKWYHIAITVNQNNVFTGYINGEYKNQMIMSRSTLANDTGVLRLNGFGFVSGTMANYFNISLKEYFNDVRIYNHCLSPKEVEEISKGLVLHYKLDKSYNLIDNNTITWTNITLGRYYVTIMNVPMSDLIEMGLKNGDKITYSLDVKALSGLKDLVLRIQHYNSSDDRQNVYSSVLTAGSEGRLSITTTLNTDYASLQLLLGNSSSGTVTENTVEQWKCIKLEACDKATIWEPDFNNTMIYDCSGYGNDGTIIGNLSAAAGSPRYEVATVFNGTNSAIKVNNNNWCSQGMEALTINLWEKTDFSNANNSRFFSCAQTGGFLTENGKSNYLDFNINVYKDSEKENYSYIGDNQALLKTGLSNQWNMITFVYDLSGVKTYLNGELHHFNEKISYGIRFNMNARLFLGCEANTANPSTPYLDGQESDFRIYATALSAAAIKELYNTGAAIDVSGNIYARELVE